MQHDTISFFKLYFPSLAVRNSLSLSRCHLTFGGLYTLSSSPRWSSRKDRKDGSSRPPMAYLVKIQQKTPYKTIKKPPYHVAAMNVYTQYQNTGPLSNSPFPVKLNLSLLIDAEARVLIAPSVPLQLFLPVATVPAYTGRGTPSIRSIEYWYCMCIALLHEPILYRAGDNGCPRLHHACYVHNM